MTTQPPTPPSGWENKPTVDHPGWGFNATSTPQPQPPKRPLYKRPWFIVGLAGLGLGLLGLIGLFVLIGAVGESNEDAASPANQAGPITTVEPNDDPTPTTTEPEPAQTEVAIGDTFTWTDGLAVSVVKVQRAKISEVAAGGNPDRHDNLVLTVKMTATRAVATDLNIVATLHYGDDGREADAVFDDDGYGGVATDFMQEHPDHLAKGRSLTGQFGFAVPKGGRTPVVFSFQPGFDYEDAIFTGRA
jgi:hypothetical protein